MSQTPANTSEPSHPPQAPQTEAERFFNRDLSWLEFNRRVLAQALDDRTPLLERVKFLAIFANNTDEFFMKRVGLLKQREQHGNLGSPARPGEMAPTDTLTACREFILEMQRLLSRCWTDELVPALRAEGIAIIAYTDLPDADRRAVDRWYEQQVFPVLTPLAVDPGHRFPFISNLSENLGVLLEKPGDPELRFARVKIPDVLPQYIRVESVISGARAAAPTRESPGRYLQLDEIVLNNADDLFPGMRIAEILPFRLTRSAAVEIEDDDVEDLLEHVEAELRMRRFASALRIQVAPEPSQRILSFLMDELDLQDEDVYTRPGPLAYADLFEIAEIDRADLKESPWRPVRPPALADPDADIFSRIRERDILVHHPYESFSDSVERFVAAAAKDPDVLAIKQTLYRTSKDSPFVGHLVQAAEEGKQVACLVELRARFDEEKNVQFARQLEAAGVHVAYGVVGLKTHCKCSVVVRRERLDGQWGIRTYCHLGTGNYHPKTAQLYTDLGLLTCDPAITSDASRLFNALTGHAAAQDYERLIVAPADMRPRFIAMIDREIGHARAGRPARIMAKMNSLEDREITEALYRASSAGVTIDLIVRGFCCLRPGVAGMSDNITLRSVIGRFLEHSRVYAFANGSDDPRGYEYYMGSADWMYRNLSARVEAITPVLDTEARGRLAQLFEVSLRDRRNAWLIGPDGRSEQLMPPEDADPDSPEAMGTFATLMRLAGNA
ncbi:MAG: polyphosphate kinase 1 [Phycisphaerales bacterium]|nr:polyphosphate kinase 1 [Planctomycetota bacterium]MCH8509672.1 polyphosphate kinase 1 [Phycisphaerales bacterium]